MNYDEAKEAARARAEEALVENLTLGTLREELRIAVIDGVRGAMTEEAAKEFWGVGIGMLQEQAAKRAGRFVIDGLWFALRRAFWVVVTLVGVYALGGWHLLVTVWNAIFSKV